MSASIRSDHGNLKLFVVAALSLVLLTGVLSPDAAESQGFMQGSDWRRAESPEALGYSSEALAAAEEYAGNIDTAAVMIIVDDVVLYEWGETARKFNVHSIRKSLLSALYGIHVELGDIDLSLSMEQLGVDDNAPSLTEVEKSATIHDLLKARSGIYHPALYESASMAAARPPRHSHAPGTFWYYNNWDFNALGTIFRNLTRTDVFQDFRSRIGLPLGMQDFDHKTDGLYFTGPDSVYPAYPFRLTARDMARFGLLYLHEGAWGGVRVLPRHWVKESVTSYSDAGDSGGYGYMWWVAAEGKHLPNVDLVDGAFSARGAGGHYILVIPSHDMVIVHRVNTDVAGNSVSGAEFGTLVQMILDAELR